MLLIDAEPAASVAGVGVTGVAASVEAGFFFGCLPGRFEAAWADVEAALTSASLLFAGDDGAPLLRGLGADPHRLQ